MANIDQSKLNPQQQAALFEMLKASGQQPVAGGQPVNPAQTDPMAMAGTGPVGAEQMGALFNGASATQTPEMPAPGSFKNNPQGAIDFLTKANGAKLIRTKSGELAEQVPHWYAPARLFGAKSNKTVEGPNFFDSLVGTYGEQAVSAILPSETKLTPEGKPMIDGPTLAKLEGLLPKGQKNAADAPNPALGKQMLGKIERQYGKDSPEYQNAFDTIQSMGGLSLSKLAEYNSSFGVPTKENDFVPDKESGLMLRFNRATQSYEPVPGQSVGLSSSLRNPVNRDLFNRAISRFDSDSVVKETKNTLNLLGNVSSILESDNPAAIGVLFSNIAKSVGKEAGVLTEGDIARAVGDPSWAAQLSRWYNKRVDFFRDPQKAQLSERDVKDFRGLFRDIATSAQQRYSTSVDRHRKALKTQIPDMSDEFIDSAFDVSVPFIEGKNRRLPGQATNYAPKKEGVTKSGVKFKVIP
jgi:hypothetical protein